MEIWIKIVDEMSLNKHTTNIIIKVNTLQNKIIVNINKYKYWLRLSQQLLSNNSIISQMCLIVDNQLKQLLQIIIKYEILLLKPALLLIIISPNYY